MTFRVKFGEIYKVGGDDSPKEWYEGDYEVTPKTGEQILLTANKMMAKDMTVEAIPYAETTNVSNGKTVTIG